MTVKAIRTRFKDCPAAIATRGFFPESKTHITQSKEYNVFAICIFEGLVVVQFINDVNFPSWLPAWCFEVCDPSIPADWICNFFDTEPSMVLGPEFIAKDVRSYNAMVELDPEPVSEFWRRFDAASASEESAEK